jgi:hypothetical protein
MSELPARSAGRKNSESLSAGRPRTPEDLILDAHHGGLAEDAAAFADDQNIHGAAIRAAVLGDQADRMGVGRQAKDARSGDGLSGLEQRVKRHTRRVRFGRIAAAAIVDHANPGAAGALGNATGSAENSKADVVRNSRRARDRRDAIDDQAPVVEVPGFADGDQALRLHKRDRKSRGEIDDGTNGEDLEELRAWRASRKPPER